MNLQSAEEYLKSNKKHGEAYEFDSKLNVIPVYDAIMITHKYATLYATEKVKEALKLAAERAALRYSYELKWGKSYLEVDPDSILSLETVLIEPINKEK